MEPLRFLLRAFVAAALLVTVVGAAAAVPAVRCDALVGFNGTVREGRFAPLMVSIENPGARCKAQIAITVSWGALRGTPPGVTITREAVLDAGSTLRFPFVIPVPRDVRTLQLTVTSGGAQVGSLEVGLRPLTTSSRLVAGISSDLSFDGLSALGGSAGALRVVYPRVDDLPRSWAGYDGLDAVIVHDTYFQQLRSDQVAALERWVATGGVLVFTGGAAALQHASAGFAGLLPVQITGLVQRDGLVGLPAGGWAPGRLPGRVELAASRVTSGRLVSSDGELPLVVQRKLGRGSVWFLAFDPTEAPVSRWSGALSMWRGILDGDRLPALAAAQRTAPEDPWITGVLAASAGAFPPLPAVLLFVGAYLVALIPLLLSRSGSTMNARRRVLLLACVTVVGGAAGWLAFNHLLFHPGLHTVDAARVESRSGDGLADVTEKVAYFASSAQAVEAKVGSADAVLEAAGFRAQPDAPLQETHLVLSEAHPYVLVGGMRVQRLGARLLVARDVIPFNVSVLVRASESVLSAEVRNGNTRALQGCFILVSGRAYPLGDIAAGASVQRTWSASDGLGSASDGVTGRDNGRRAALFKAVFEAEGFRGGPARLVGWMDGPVLPLAFAGSTPAGGLPGIALVTVEAE
jgi:hypothetical protein